MIDIKRLRKIMEEKGTDPDVTMHDLVREVLKRDYDKEDYSLENISEPVEEDEDDSTEARAKQGSIVHRNFQQVEVNFRDFNVEVRKGVKLDAYDKEAQLFETIESLRTSKNKAWTHALKANPSNENHKL